MAAATALTVFVIAVDDNQLVEHHGIGWIFHKPNCQPEKTLSALHCRKKQSFHTV